ncbi:Flp family type IVb pilin [Phenylobacterium montanum]|uniref:Flp family type IVb pilin n=1 Tax=Phenylobacterium montanum TaxID=2823693 RepID=UPI002012D294|nr:Flp family type IVb pilin [Caulobacter sp. S6]
MASRLSLKAFLADERGTTAVEYGLICALIFLVIVTSVSAFGNKTTNMMNTVSAAIGGAIGG